MTREMKQSGNKERGQAVMLVLVALSLFLLGAFGIAVDGSQLYAHRQMAQAAADAAAQAGIMSVLDRTNTAANSNYFGTDLASITCATGSTLTPCYYARLNRFGPENGDTVRVDFNTAVPADVANLLATDTTPNRISVTITRTVTTGLMRFLGTSSSRVVGHATAAIMLPPVPIPIIVTHPTLKEAFQISGGGAITITHGPSTSIQVNSCANSGGTGTGTNGLACQNGNAIKSSGGNGSCTGTCIDLSAAGPGGVAGKFGNWGDPSTWSAAGNGVLLPAVASTYVDPSSALADPLIAIAAPAQPALAPAIVPNVALGTNGCPAAACDVYSPGYYPNGINVGGGNWVLFKPGLYYVKTGTGSGPGFQLSPANAQMATGVPSDASTGTGMTIYLSGDALVNIQGGTTINLLGDTTRTTFGGMLFFKDRAGTGGTHHLSGGSGMSLTGTIYMTRGTNATNATSGYNLLNIAASGSTTNLAGEIIADAINLNGSANVQMNLTGAFRDVHQVALVQ